MTWIFFPLPGLKSQHCPEMKIRLADHSLAKYIWKTTWRNVQAPLRRVISTCYSRTAKLLCTELQMHEGAQPRGQQLSWVQAESQTTESRDAEMISALTLGRVSCTAMLRYNNGLLHRNQNTDILAIIGTVLNRNFATAETQGD